MFSLRGKVLAQANIQDAAIRKLMRPPEGFSGLPDTNKRTGSKRLDANTVSAIGSLRFGLSGVSFKARVVKKAEVRAVTSRDGNSFLVCDVTLSDGTGEIPLGVWNSQIGTVSLGDTIQIHNAKVRSFRGQLQLSLGRKTGLMTVLERAS
jgi:ssDNA-binding replication factor A large subunit